MPPPERNGRPPIAEERCIVHLTLQSDLYDWAYAQSRQERCSVPEIIRRAVERARRAPDRQPSA